MSDYLIRDENGEPVRQWITRDRLGRFRTPLLAFVWPVVPNPVPDDWPGDPFAGIPNARDEDNRPF